MEKEYFRTFRDFLSSYKCTDSQGVEYIDIDWSNFDRELEILELKVQQKISELNNGIEDMHRRL